jgi:hypothetical protein
MSKTTKQQTTKNAKTIDTSNESVREQIARELISDSEKMLSEATDKNYEQIAATARLCERLAHAILFDMTRALKRCEKATRSLKLSKNVRSYLAARFESLSKI